MPKTNTGGTSSVFRCSIGFAFVIGLFMRISLEVPREAGLKLGKIDVLAMHPDRTDVSPVAVHLGTGGSHKLLMSEIEQVNVRRISERLFGLRGVDSRKSHTSLY